MRQSEKAQLLDILGTMDEALDFLHTQPAPDMRELMAASLMQGMQVIQAACASATRLPAGSYPSADSLLLALEGEDLPAANAILADIRRLLGEEPLQYKVVFFPYLGSTWDSLASVRDAFAADERFITDVVILPAHRDTLKGRVNLYEDFLADTDIPHTRYTDYDLEQDKPDIAFMNNPYDSVISPLYSTIRIRENSRLLIYVPYYGILSGNSTFNQPALYNQPMHLVADAIIVPNETGSEAYNRFCTGPKGRYLPLGTPKTDYFQRSVAESGQRVDDAWVQRIGQRPVFLLDTHYLLEVVNYPTGDDEWQNQIVFLANQTINYFADHPDCFLIWRPHPMAATVLENYGDRAFCEEYRQALSRARSTPNVIVDDSSDSSAAVALSCALIATGPGSLPNSYASLGKPVVRINESPCHTAGEKPFLPTADIFYTAPILELFYLLMMRSCGGVFEPGSDLAAKESALVARLDSDLADSYWQLRKAIDGGDIYSPEAAAQMQKKSAFPERGHYDHLQSAFNIFQRYTPEFLQAYWRFYYALYEGYATAEVNAIFDTLAAGEDPLHDAHQAAYTGALANCDGSCGQAVHAAVTHGFFSLAQEAAVKRPRSGPAPIRKKRKKKK